MKLRKATTKLTSRMMAVTALLLLLLMRVMEASSPSSSSLCPTEEEEVAIESMVLHSDLVVLGKVMRRLPDKGASLQLYKVEMKVLCIYKGHNVPRMLNISAAGNLSDPCPDHQMEVDQLYMAYLYKHDHTVFIPAFPHQPGTYKDEMFVFCELNISRPIGPMEPEDSEVKCEDDKQDYDDFEEQCIRFTPKPGDSALRGKKAPNQPGKTGKIGGDSDGGDPAGGNGSARTSMCLSTALALWATVRTLLL